MTLRLVEKGLIACKLRARAGGVLGAAVGLHVHLDADLLAGTAWRSVLVVNIGHPAERAWHDRLPRLAHDDAVLTL